MTAIEIKLQLDTLASQLLAISQQLNELTPELSLACDQKAAQSIIRDIFWAVENCTTIGLHQIGQALDDTMGVQHEK